MNYNYAFKISYLTTLKHNSTHVIRPLIHFLKVKCKYLTMRIHADHSSIIELDKISSIIL